MEHFVGNGVEPLERGKEVGSKPSYMGGFGHCFKGFLKVW